MANFTSYIETPAERQCYNLHTPANLVELEKMSLAVQAHYGADFGRDPQSDDAINVTITDDEIIFWYERPTASNFSSIFQKGGVRNV